MTDQNKISWHTLVVLLCGIGSISFPTALFLNSGFVVEAVITAAFSVPMVFYAVVGSTAIDTKITDD